MSIREVQRYLGWGIVIRMKVCDPCLEYLYNSGRGEWHSCDDPDECEHVSSHHFDGMGKRP